MIKVGNPPYLECSSKGDKRFSAFYALVNGRSIEVQYQAAKVFEGGITGLSWRQAKGRYPINSEQVRVLYKSLWKQYLQEHPELKEFLLTQSGLSDMFGQAGHVCQASTLWEIIHESPE